MLTSFRMLFACVWFFFILYSHHLLFCSSAFCCHFVACACVLFRFLSTFSKLSVRIFLRSFFVVCLILFEFVMFFEPKMVIHAFVLCVSNRRKIPFSVRGIERLISIPVCFNVFNILCNQVFNRLCLNSWISKCAEFDKANEIAGKSKKKEQKTITATTSMERKKNTKREENKCPWENSLRCSYESRCFARDFFSPFSSRSLSLSVIHFSLNQSHLTASSLSSYYYHHYVSLTRKKSETWDPNWEKEWNRYTYKQIRKEWKR